MGTERIFGTEEMENQEYRTVTEISEAGVERETIGAKEQIGETANEVELVFGNPEEADDHWHLQSEKNSCAIACQEFVAEQLLDRELNEQEMIAYAKERDWYDPAEGTSISDVGNLLEAVGIDVERVENQTIHDLARALADGEKIICGVNNMILLEPSLADLPGISANHAVEVIGIDFSDLERPQVVLNDPGVINGQGIRHDLNVFLDAWKTSNHFAVIASKEVA